MSAYITGRHTHTPTHAHQLVTVHFLLDKWYWESRRLYRSYRIYRCSLSSCPKLCGRFTSLTLIKILITLGGLITLLGPSQCLLGFTLSFIFSWIINRRVVPPPPPLWIIITSKKCMWLPTWGYLINQTAFLQRTDCLTHMEHAHIIAVEICDP